jgi:hypothetical protein
MKANIQINFSPVVNQKKKKNIKFHIMNINEIYQIYECNFFVYALSSRHSIGKAKKILWLKTLYISLVSYMSFFHFCTIK